MGARALIDTPNGQLYNIADGGICDNLDAVKAGVLNSARMDWDSRQERKALIQAPKTYHKFSDGLQAEISSVACDGDVVVSVNRIARGMNSEPST